MLFLLKTPTETKGYISAKKAAKRLGITSSRIRLLASQGRVEGAYRDLIKGWQFPKTEIIITPGKRGPSFGQSKSKKSLGVKTDPGQPKI